MVVSMKKGNQHRPKSTMILLRSTPKVETDLWNAKNTARMPCFASQPTHQDAHQHAPSALSWGHVARHGGYVGLESLGRGHAQALSGCPGHYVAISTDDKDV